MIVVFINVQIGKDSWMATFWERSVPVLFICLLVILMFYNVNTRAGFGSYSTSSLSLPLLRGVASVALKIQTQFSNILIIVSKKLGKF